jgi:hypothetical protein
MSRRTAQSSGVGIIYQPIADATAKAERDALANVFKFLLFESRASQKDTGEPTLEPDATARAKYGEEVSHVEHRTRSTIRNRQSPV